jgi:hypothetical protein
VSTVTFIKLADDGHREEFVAALEAVQKLPIYQLSGFLITLVKRAQSEMPFASYPFPNHTASNFILKHFKEGAQP